MPFQPTPTSSRLGRQTEGQEDEQMDRQDQSNTHMPISIHPSMCALMFGTTLCKHTQPCTHGHGHEFRQMLWHVVAATQHWAPSQTPPHTKHHRHRAEPDVCRGTETVSPYMYRWVRHGAPSPRLRRRSSQTPACLNASPRIFTSETSH